MTFTDLHLFSIHAPYAGATSDERTLSKYPIYFNPHPHKGATSGDYLVSSRTAAVNRREIFAFWERFANDLHRPPPDCHKKGKKARKTGRWRSVEVKYILNTRSKKSIFFFSIERFVNDRRRPAPFFNPRPM